ncbi:endoribonuclease MazF [Sporolactobacillus sp. STCC-11]|uniref:endoribonuclease MazF n=1 Tax=Sporolactobacillus caesalpiniae TaxID=3230362 RepID=UPI0033952D56
MTYVPERGDLVFFNFNPQSGHEQAGHRPAIVLSPETFNRATHFALVCPITSQKKGYPFEVDLPQSLSIEGVILTDQLKSLNWHARHFHYKDRAPAHVIDDCLKLIQTILFQS